MSSSTPDLVPSDTNVNRFYHRNDLHIFINDRLFFGFRTGPNVTWGNLCACMDTLVALTSGYSGLFRPKQPPSNESIAWDLQTRQTFGNCKAYDFLVSFQGQPPLHPRPGNIAYKQIVPRPRTGSRAGTPSKTPTLTASTVSPFPMTPSDSRSGTSTPVDTQPQPHDVRAARRAARIPSPMQNKKRASKAPQRCWDVYKQCCITGTGPLLKNDVAKPPDIIACHIFPHSYHQAWVSIGWSTFCTDRGPDGNCSHEYTGYHQICCLNNMIPMHADVHDLWDAYEIGVDIHDNYCVISFSEGREDLAACHLKADQVDPQYHPLPELLFDHLAQGVWRCCLFPGWGKDGQQLLARLDFVTEEKEGISFEDDEPEADERADPAASLSAQLQRLGLDSQGGAGAVPGAYEQINQFSMKEREHGQGKAAFEDYLHAALSIRNDAVPMLWGYTQED